MILLYILIFLLLTGITFILLFEFVLKKWKCTEGSCEKVIGGDYSNKKDCEKSCKKS
jgi:hypothetical protein